MLKVKNYNGGYWIDYESKEFKIFVDEINKNVIELINEVLKELKESDKKFIDFRTEIYSALRTMDTGSNSNADNFSERIEKLEISLKDYKIEQYKSEIENLTRMKNNRYNLKITVIAIAAFILAVFNIILLITTR